MFKKSLLVAAAALVLPVAANAQTGTSYPGFYIGAEGGLNWLLNNNSYQMDTGWAAGGKLGYDFVGPRVELEGLYHSNTGTGNVLFPGGVANVRGRIDQVSVMANLLYDFMPTSAFTPFIGAGAGIAFVDSTIQGCNMCSTQFAYQGIIGVAWNITEAFRLSVDGRYYGTTNPGAYTNNNIMTMLSLSYKFGQPEMAPPPPPPPAGGAAVVHGVLRLGSRQPLRPGARHHPAGRRRLQVEGQRPHHRHRPHRHVGPGELQHGAVAAGAPTRSRTPWCARACRRRRSP